jgi:hypothetical protein
VSKQPFILTVHPLLRPAKLANRPIQRLLPAWSGSRCAIPKVKQDQGLIRACDRSPRGDCGRADKVTFQGRRSRAPVWAGSNGSLFGTIDAMKPTKPDWQACNITVLPILPRMAASIVEGAMYQFIGAAAFVLAAVGFVLWGDPIMASLLAVCAIVWGATALVPLRKGRVRKHDSLLRSE